MRKVDCEQGSHEWHCLRHGRVTGTTLKSALGSKKVQETLMMRVISERMTEPMIDDINAPQVVRGKEMEPQARLAVIKHTGLEFAETGFLVSDEFDGFGFSPDGIYEQDGKIIGGIELKCPGSKNHVEYIFGNCVPADYEYQVKAPFIMSDDVQWWYFASYDDRNYQIPLFVTKVSRAELKDIDADREKLKQFLADVKTRHAEIVF